MLRQAALVAGQQPLAPSSAAHLQAMQAWLSLVQGDEAAAVDWAQRHELSADQALNHAHEREYLTWIRVLIWQRRLDEAAKWLARLLQLAEAQGRTGSLIEILMLHAEAWQASGEVNQALERLAQALSLAEPEGYIRLFVDEGAPIALLLAQMRPRRGPGPARTAAYREQLLALLDDASGEPRPPAAGTTPEAGLPARGETLSERELEVLKLIVAGCSNNEIADRLVIAVSTVKWYVNAIYGKLEVKSRTKAIARARELKIALGA